MKYILSAFVLFAMSFAVNADDEIYKPKIIEIYKEPNFYVNKRIFLKSLKCADVKDGFVCLYSQSNKKVYFDGVVLGENTENDAIDRLQKCKGIASLNKHRCTFKIFVEPKSVIIGSNIKYLSQNITINLIEN